MDQVHVIRHKVLSEGLSCRRVADEVGVSRNTVRKYLEEAEPRRDKKRDRRRPVVEAAQERLEELLSEWKGKTTKKQRITARRLHRELVKEGYRISERTVCRFMRERKRRKVEVPIPLIHLAGDEAQIDFFEVVVDILGQRSKAWKFLMRLMYSGKDFAWIYPRQDQIAFLDGHVRGFEYFGGVPKRCVYDNLRCAVAKFLIGSERKLTARFASLVNHYQFEPCFTRARRGDDKGGVEARGKGIRLRHLTPIPNGKSLRAISIVLLERIASDEVGKRDGRTIREGFREEQKYLRELPADGFEARRLVQTEVNRLARVTLEGASYSVPSRWKRLPLTAYIGVDEVEFVCQDERIRRPRVGRGSKQIRYRDYLPELSRRPQAVRQVAPALMGELGEPFETLWKLLVESHGEKRAARTMASILGVVVKHGERPVAAALTDAVKSSRTDLLGLAPLIRGEAAPAVQVPSALSGYRVEAVEARSYDRLIEGGSRS
ncbi:MAG: IS21 family transposase [Dehalococcoidia bacterium]